MSCPPNVQCLISEAQVNQAFMAAPPLIDQQILDLSLRSPSWITDLPKVSPFPLGAGTTFQQIVFRGEMPQIERGFNQWAMLDNNTGCDPCAGPNCAYNTTKFGGTAMERKTTRIMYRDFESPSYCVKLIQTTYEFEQVMAKIIQNLYAQIAFFKEQNICFNALTELAKKFVIDSSGPQPNPQNPYMYRRAGTARIGTLTIEALTFFYEWMRRIPECVPYDVVNGSPIYALMCSQELLARLYRDDPQSRQDVRFSGLANDMLMKYNFMSTIRGMFIPAPILFPRRFNLTVSTGVPVEVFPYVNGIPAEVGTYTGVNPAYMAATHEEVLVHGKYPFELLVMPTAATLGNNTSFGPEFSFMENWQWINPQTVTDPVRRVGFFFTSATIGIAPQYSEGLFGVLVERPKPSLAYGVLPDAPCPPDPVDCDNDVPDVGCPCALITGYVYNPVAEDYIIYLSVATEAVAEDTIQFGITSGGYITGTVVDVSSDGLSVEVTFPNGTVIDCDQFTSIFCDNTLGCSSAVTNYSISCTDNTRYDLILANPIKVSSGSVTLYYGDGTSATVTVISQDFTTNTLVVDVGGTAICDKTCGVIAVCVPTATDATCPGCTSVTTTQCET